MNLALLLTVLLGSPGAQPSVRDSEAEEGKAWLEFFTSQAREYEIFPTDDSEEKFRLLPHPVFRHAAPSRGNDDIGAVYLWVQDDGRPAVIGAIFGWSVGDGFRQVVHEIHSLAAVPVTGVWRNRDRWTPRKAGIDWKLVSDAPTPARSSVERLRQMKFLARRFGAYSIDWRGDRWELRLVPTPLYKYELKADGSVLAGALFAICQDTNTDVLLWIEARRVEDVFRWHYGCASFADWELHVELDDIEVWTDPNAVKVRRGQSNVHWVRKIGRIKPPEDTKVPSVGKRRAVDGRDMD